MPPNFICIGAQKAGTTWLHVQLEKHPHLWLPPVKELHYFDRLPGEIYHTNRNSLWDRFTDSSPSNVLWRNDFRGILKRCLKRLFLSSMTLWGIRYLFGKPSDSWHDALFEHGNRRVKGYLTPSYSALSSKCIEHVHRMIPKTKIIFIMRNPVERIWSQARFQAKRGYLDLADEGKVLEFFNKKGVNLRSNYIRTLDDWGAYFPKEQFLIGFFEEIAECPGDLLSRIYNFLGVDPLKSNITSKGMSEKVNKSPQNQIPLHHLAYLARQQFDQIQELHHRFGSYATKWLEVAQPLV